MWCNAIHRPDEAVVGQPLCSECYDYIGHVLFNWHAPELWRRFTIALRRAVTAHLRQIGAGPVFSALAHTGCDGNVSGREDWQALSASRSSFAL